jgi:hypothetical protein
MGGTEHDQSSCAGPASPPVTHERLAAALTELTRRVREADIRAQLGGLAALLGNLDSRIRDQEARGPLETAIATAIAAGDEAAVIAAMRRLAALDRAVLVAVDWEAVTRG